MQKRNSHARRDRADTPKTENSTHFSQIRSSEDGKSRVTLRWERIKPQNRGQFGSGRKDSNRKRNTSTTSNGTRKHTPGTSRSGERIHGTSPSGERIHDTSERIKHRDSGLFFSPDNTHTPKTLASQHDNDWLRNTTNTSDLQLDKCT